MPNIFQFSRYILVSALALSVDFGVFLALIKIKTIHAVLAGVLGYSTGLIVHFLLSNRFVFSNARNKHIVRLFSEFALTGIVGLVLTAATIKFAMAGLGTSAVMAKAIAVVISFIAVFILRKTIVFSDFARSEQ